MPPLNRRQFLTAASTAALAASLPRIAIGQPKPPDVILAVIGMGGRGTGLAQTFASLPGVFIKYVCDVDEKRAGGASKTVAAKQTLAPQPMVDFRKAVEDKEVSGVVIATPNHWHAPAAILALSAGKHAYVEKPCSHNPREGELLVSAAVKNNKCVQHGTQRRSWPGIIEAITKVKQGAIGKVLFSRSWYTNNRPSIGKVKASPPPAGLDWSLWQGPAPEVEFRDNFVPYNWHWFWHWGNGECGNNGVHSLDLCRWGLGVDTPIKVTSNGGRYHFSDDQQTPDTQFATFDYGDKSIHWEGRSCHPRGVENNSGFGVGFYGDGGSIILDSAGYTHYDIKNKEIAKVPGTADEKLHTQNFVDAIRANDPARLAAPITEGAAAALMCHLANIAQRTGRTLHLDAKTKQIKDDADSMKLWAREYRAGWEPKV